MGRNPKIHEPIEASFDEALSAIADENKPLEQTISARPFVKWVGGKRSILSAIIERIPETYEVYHEPFVGGGALYFAKQPERAFLADVNFHLVITYQAVRDDVDRLIKNLKQHERNHEKEYYLKCRERLSKEKDPVKIAALLIYLNKTGYNGLYRVNKSGKFNVPMGKYENPQIVDEENLRNCSKVLQGATIVQRDFTQEKIYKDDFYYIDPPYHETYDGYDGSGFGDEEHKNLAEFCHKINRKGGYFMLSNSNTELVRSLYDGYTIENVSAGRYVSCKSRQRGREDELIIRNYQ